MNKSFISTQQIKDLINEQKFTSTQEIMNCMKNMFADVLEQTLHAEMDQHLSYEYAKRRNDDAEKNYRNGSVKRTMKTQLGEVEVNVPRDIATENSNQRSFQSIGISTYDIKEQIKGSICGAWLGRELGHSKHVFRLSCGGPKNHLYDKCDRRTESTIQKSDKDKECIP